MEKFKKCIQIGDNVTDIMKLPCVIGVTKEIWDEKDIRLRYSLFGDVVSSKYDLGDNVYAYKGDWLCEGYDGSWHKLSNNEYESK